MDDAFAAVGGAAGAVAAANAAGKKGFFKGKFGGVCKICSFFLQELIIFVSKVSVLILCSFIIAKPKPVSAAVRKKRMNFRLRKILTPKSPLMVLNEIVGGVNYTFVDTPSTMLTPGIPHLFTAQCEVSVAKI